MKNVHEFQDRILSFYKNNKRDLPWRKTTNPYHIFLSEVMLQQTQVPRVVEKYAQFIKVLPDFQSLASASLLEVLSLWQGLGYNRRALYLQKSAQIILKKHGGIVPKTPAELELLPGIGPATARSIIVYSYNIPLVFIETNVRRTFIHHFFSDQKDVDDKDLYPYVELSLDTKNPKEWYWAIMDYGSYLGKNPPAGGENPNRKSAHYTKQSKFEGSLRQVRGKILKILLKKKSVSIKNLQQELPTQPEFLKKALKQLDDEGFININNRVVSF